jgi:hypothetical protein
VIGVWDDNGAYPGGFGSLTIGLPKDVSDVSQKEIGDTYLDMMVVAVMMENLKEPTRDENVVDIAFAVGGSLPSRKQMGDRDLRFSFAQLFAPSQVAVTSTASVSRSTGRGPWRDRQEGTQSFERNDAFPGEASCQQHLPECTSVVARSPVVLSIPWV